MMTGVGSWLALALVTLLACGDNSEAPCDPEWQGDAWRIDGCPAALLFAARDTMGLLPTQSEADRYLERWRRAIDAEPLLSNRIPQRYRIHGGSFDVNTTDQRIIDAWSQSVLETGDIPLDQMLTRIRVTLGPVRDRGTHHTASIYTTYIFNEELLAADLRARSSWMSDPEVLPRDDGTWVWLDATEQDMPDAATARIDFLVGWGDCFVSCLGFRKLQAIVPPEGPATVYDLGGNELPPWLSLSPNTKPLP